MVHGCRLFFYEGSNVGAMSGLLRVDGGRLQGRWNMLNMVFVRNASKRKERYEQGQALVFAEYIASLIRSIADSCALRIISRQDI